MYADTGEEMSKKQKHYAAITITILMIIIAVLLVWKQKKIKAVNLFEKSLVRLVSGFWCELTTLENSDVIG